MGSDVLVPVQRRPPRARHVAGDLPLRVRRPAPALGLRDDALLIEVEGLSKRFGKTQAVNDLCFTAKPGLVTGFLGPNGAGKSTTLRALLGLVHQDARRRHGARAVATASSTAPSRTVGAVLEAIRVPSRTLGPQPPARPRAAARPRRHSRVEEVLALVELSGAREAARRRLLARHAAAARARRRAARRPGGARPRRAGERARPAGHPLAARPAPVARRGGAHDPRLEPCARRDGADRRRRRDHREAAGSSCRRRWRRCSRARRPAATRVRSPERDRLAAAARRRAG